MKFSEVELGSLFQDLTDGLVYRKTAQDEATLIVQRIKISLNEVVGHPMTTEAVNRLVIPYETEAPLLTLCERCQSARTVQARRLKR